MRPEADTIPFQPLIPLKYLSCKNITTNIKESLESFSMPLSEDLISILHNVCY